MYKVTITLYCTVRRGNIQNKSNKNQIEPNWWLYFMYDCVYVAMYPSLYICCLHNCVFVYCICVCVYISLYLYTVGWCALVPDRGGWDKKLRQCSREWPLIRIIRSTTWLTSKWSGSRLGARQHPLWKPLNILTSVSWGRSILKAACQRFLPDHCRITKGNKASWCPRRCSAFQSLNTITKVSDKPCYNGVRTSGFAGSNLRPDKAGRKEHGPQLQLPTIQDNPGTHRQMHPYCQDWSNTKSRYICNCCMAGG